MWPVVAHYGGLSQAFRDLLYRQSHKRSLHILFLLELSSRVFGASHYDQLPSWLLLKILSLTTLQNMRDTNTMVKAIRISDKIFAFP
jgi:hypothetical protein